MVLFIMYIVFMVLNGVMVLALIIGVGATMMSLFMPSNQGLRSICLPGLGVLCLIETLPFCVLTAPEEGMRPENIVMYCVAINVAVIRTVSVFVIQYRADHAPDPIDIEYQQLLAEEKR